MIALLTSSYPSWDGDPRGHFVRDFGRAVTDTGRRVTVVAPRSAAGPRTLAGDPARVHEVGAPGRLFGGAGLLTNLRRRPWALAELPEALSAVRRWLVSHRPELEAVVAHWLVPFGLLAAATRAEVGRPVWVVGHSGGVHALATLPGGVRRAVGAVLARGADRLTFVTEGLRERFLGLLGERAAVALEARCGVLPMGVWGDRFGGCAPRSTGPIVAVGRLTPIKGFERLIRAVASLEGAGRGRRVRLVGDGPERGRLRRLAERLGVRLELTGELPAAAIPRALHGASLLAVPSRRARLGYREGLPVALLEGLAAGLPVVTTESWAVPDDLRGLDGLIVTADDEASFARGLAGALGVEARWGDAARRAAIAGAYDWGVVGARIGAEVARLIDGPPCFPLRFGRFATLA